MDCQALFYLDIVELFLFVVFVFETMFRILAFGLSGLLKPWIIFDLLVVVSNSSLYIYQQSVSSANLDPGSVSWLRYFRVIRVQVSFCASLASSTKFFMQLLRFFRFSTSLQVLFTTMVSIIPGETLTAVCF